MPSITRYPPGLLDLLGLQSQGDNPRALSDTVSPVVDIGQLYLASTQQLVTGSGGGAIAGFNSFGPELEVPVGQVWVVHAFNVSVAAGVGVSGTFGPSLRPGAAGGARMTLSDSRDFAASRTEWKAAASTPFVMLAGYELGIEIQNLAGGNPGFSGQAIVSILRA